MKEASKNTVFAVLLGDCMMATKPNLKKMSEKKNWRWQRSHWPVNELKRWSAHPLPCLMWVRWPHGMSWRSCSNIQSACSESIKPGIKWILRMEKKNRKNTFLRLLWENVFFSRISKAVKNGCNISKVKAQYYPVSDQGQSRCVGKKRRAPVESTLTKHM